MNLLPASVLYCGRDEPLPQQITLRAGPLTAVFEQGGLRHIRLGEREVVRNVYAAVRDRYWNTPAGRMSNLRVEQGPSSFQITFDCEHRQNDIAFCWKGAITGDEQGTISFAMDGEARSTFWRNRRWELLFPHSKLTAVSNN